MNEVVRGSQANQTFRRVSEIAPRVLASGLGRGANSFWPRGNWSMFANAVLAEIIASRRTRAEIKMLCFVVRETAGRLDPREEGGRRKWTRPITLIELAEVLAVGRTSLSAAVKHLAADHVIVATDQPHTDQRSYRLNEALIFKKERLLYAAQETVPNEQQANHASSDFSAWPPEIEQTTEVIRHDINDLLSAKEPFWTG